MATPLSEQVDHSHWRRHNTIGHIITFYYWLCQSCIIVKYSSLNNGVPLKYGLKVIENGNFGCSMYDFLL